MKKKISTKIISAGQHTTDWPAKFFSEDSTCYVIDLYKKNGERASNLVNRVDAIGEVHTRTYADYVDIPKIEVDLPILDLINIVPNPKINMILVTRNNTFKAILGIKEVDVASQTMVLAGDYAKELIEGDCNARVMIPLKGQLYDVGFVISIVDGNVFQPFPGFETQNEVRVASYKASFDVLSIFVDDKPIGKVKQNHPTITPEILKEEFENAANQNGQSNVTLTITQDEDNSLKHHVILNYKNKLFLYMDHCAKHSKDAKVLITNLHRCNIDVAENPNCKDLQVKPPGKHCPPVDTWSVVFDCIINDLDAIKTKKKPPNGRFYVTCKIRGLTCEIDYHLHGTIYPLPTKERWSDRMNIWPAEYHIKGINFTTDLNSKEYEKIYFKRNVSQHNANS